MKNIHGLIIAAVLGLLGAVANFFYLNNEAQKKDMVEFIGVKDGVTLGRGEKLVEEKLVKVEIPKNHVGNLIKYTYQWNNRSAVIDRPVARTIDTTKTEGGRLLFLDDYREPPKDLRLAKGERAEFIAVPRNFDTSHVNPGDEVMFRVTTLAPSGPTRTPTPAFKPLGTPAAITGGTAATAGVPASAGAEPQPKPDETEVASQPAGHTETIGPFTVVSIGNRLGTLDVQKAAKIAPVQQNLLLISIGKKGSVEEANFETLTNYIHQFGENCFRVQLLGKE